MSIPEETIGAAVTGAALGAVTGGIGMLGNLSDQIGNLVEQIKVDAATAGDLHFDLEELADFYNALSKVHEELQGQMKKLMSQTTNVGGQPAGGSVTGVQAAWTAIRESMGAGAGSSSSLIANMMAVDNAILKFMFTIKQNVDAYAAQENYAVQSIGAAGQSGGGISIPTPTPTTAGSITHGAW